MVYVCVIITLNYHTSCKEVEKTGTDTGTEYQYCMASNMNTNKHKQSKNHIPQPPQTLFLYRARLKLYSVWGRLIKRMIVSSDWHSNAWSSLYVPDWNAQICITQCNESLNKNNWFFFHVHRFCYCHKTLRSTKAKKVIWMSVKKNEEWNPTVWRCIEPTTSTTTMWCISDRKLNWLKTSTKYLLRFVGLVIYPRCDSLRKYIGKFFLFFFFKVGENFDAGTIFCHVSASYRHSQHRGHGLRWIIVVRSY